MVAWGEHDQPRSLKTPVGPWMTHIAS